MSYYKATRLDGTDDDVVLREQHIIYPGAIDIGEGGLSQPGCDMHVRVINIAMATAWLLPYKREFWRQFARQINDMCDIMDAVATSDETGW